MSKDTNFFALFSNCSLIVNGPLPSESSPNSTLPTPLCATLLRQKRSCVWNEKKIALVDRLSIKIFSDIHWYLLNDGAKKIANTV